MYERYLRPGPKVACVGFNAKINEMDIQAVKWAATSQLQHYFQGDMRAVRWSDL